MTFTDHAVQFLRSVSRFIRAIEGVLVDLIAAVAPWLAPIVPAYMTWTNAQSQLGFPAWVAWAVAGVVEFLGLSAIYTTFQFWDWDDDKRKTDQRAPIQIAIITAIFYLMVVITVNVMLDKADTIHKVAKTFLTSMSVIASIILALRSQHARRTEDVIEEKRIMREERKQQRDQLHTPEVQNIPVNFRPEPEISDWRQLPDKDRQKVAGMTTRQVMDEFGVEERTARNWRAYANNGYGNGLQLHN